MTPKPVTNNAMVTLRLPKPLKNRLRDRAWTLKRTLSQLIVMLLEAQLDAQTRAHEDEMRETARDYLE